MYIICFSLAKYNSDDMKIIIVKIIEQNLNIAPLFINEYFKIHLISNLFLHVLNLKTNRDLILKIIQDLIKNKKYLNINENEFEVLEELNRLKIIGEKLYNQDEEIKKSLLSLLN
jgi:hypothetical protein